jgi:hypothetical protein
VRYVAWVERVFEALAAAEQGSPLTGGVSLSAVAERLGLGAMDRDTFAAHGEPAEALMTAMYDLDAIGLVDFTNVAHGNRLTAAGREVTQHGFGPIHAECWSILLSEPQTTFLARLCRRSIVEADEWADLTFVDVPAVYDEIWPAEPGAEYVHDIQRRTFLEDLRAKGLLRRMGVDELRPTYVAAVIVTEPDPRSGARRGGLIDWPRPTPGFEAIEDRIGELKMLLEGALTDDDLSDVGRRCRDIAADAVDVVFREEMVPPCEGAPSRQDAEGRLALYLAARAPGDDFEELRRFLRAALALAHARTHSARTGPAAAVAAAQGLISFVRALQAVERYGRGERSHAYTS